MNHPFIIVGIGELLWDIFEEEKHLGGAPANFAFHTNRLDDDAFLVSRIGNDSLGDEIKEKLAFLNLSSDYIQIDPEHPTGTVQVTVDHEGQPRYEIVEPVAWDYIAWQDNLCKLAAKTDAVCFGSLAQRSLIAHQTIQRFIEHMPAEGIKVLDVNLRKSYYNPDILRQSLSNANLVKMNDLELEKLSDIFSVHSSHPDDKMRHLFEQFGMDFLCVTKGEQGCTIMNHDRIVNHPGYAVEVADTVGSGDAFTAVMLYHYLRKSPLETIAAAANRMGSRIASCNGGTPVLDDAFLEAIKKPL